MFCRESIVDHYQDIRTFYVAAIEFLILNTPELSQLIKSGVDVVNFKGDTSKPILSVVPNLSRKQIITVRLIPTVRIINRRKVISISAQLYVSIYSVDIAAKCGFE